MKKIIFLIALLSVLVSEGISQNVGIGTVTPTNTLHVVPTSLSDPIRVEGLNLYTNESTVMVVDPSTGVLKYMPINNILANVDSLYLDSTILSTVINNFDTIFGLMRDSLLLDSIFMNTLRDSIDTDIDSMVFVNDTLYLYEDNQVLTTYINSSLDTALVDSLIVSSSDTLYTIISDSLLQDTLWISQLDSLLSIYGDTIYFNDSSYTLVRDSLLNDSLFLDSLISLIGDSINTDDQNIDSLTLTGTILTTHIENGASANIDLGNLLDSVIYSKSDTLYSIISDSLTRDSLWIKQIDSLLSIYGDTIYFNDSSYTLVRDSLLQDSLFLDSLISLLGDSIDTDIDSVVLIGDSLHIYEDGVDAVADISGILDSIKTVDSLFTPDYVIFADSNGRLSEDTILHFKTAINQRGDRALLLNTDTIINTRNSAWTQFQAYKKETNYEGVVSLEDGYIGVNMAGLAAPTIHLDISGGTINNQVPLDVTNRDNRATGTIIFRGVDSTTQGTQAFIQGTSKSYFNQKLLTGFTFSGRTRSTPANPNGTFGYNFPNYSNNSELLFEINNDGDGAIKGYFYKDSRNDTTPINNFLYTDANGVFQSKSIDSLIQLMRDSVGGGSGTDADWDINVNGTGLEGAPAGNNSADGLHAISAGFNDTASGNYSVVSGGLDNVVTETSSVIGGGNENSILAPPIALPGGNQFSTIAGGYRNTINEFGTFSTIAGGADNFAQNSYSTVGGGVSNVASGNSSTVSGGSVNLASGLESFVGGGDRDTASGDNSVVVGGLQNKAIGAESFVGGGESNKAEGLNSSVIGGYQNLASGFASFSSGYRDTAQGSYSLAAGRDNKVTGSYSTVSGYRNKVLSSYSHAGGRDNHISGSSYGFIHGINDTLEGTVQGGFIAGENNVSRATVGITGRNAVFGADNRIITNDAGNASHTLSIFGGSRNSITGVTGIGATIVGGADNSINGTASFPGTAMIIGGSNNAITGLGGPSNSRSVLIGGSNNSILGANDAVNLGGQDNTISANATRAITIGGIDNTATGLNSIAGGQTTTARTLLEVTIGRFNDLANSPTGNAGTWNASHALFTVGNGTGVFTRSNAFQVLKNGQTYAAGFNVVSDKNYKIEFTKIENPLDRVLKVNSYNYFFNETYKPIYGDLLQTGFIAQEIQEIFPELVTSSQGKLAVNYIGLIPVLTEAIKEQQELIDNQDKEIKELKEKSKEIDVLKKELEEIKKMLESR